MLFELNQPEQELLVEVLSSALGSLREEIYKTEAAEYEVALKHREAMLTNIIARLNAAGASGLSIGEPTTARV